MSKEKDEGPVNLADVRSTQHKSIQQLFEAINLGPVQHLNLFRKYGNVALDDRQLGVLLRSLSKYNSLDIVNLNGNFIAKHGCNALIELIATNPITCLELRINYTGDFYILPVIRALTKRKHIKTLTLGACSIGPKICQGLEPLLNLNTLTHLDLSTNSLNPEGAGNLARSLRANKSITYLDLRDTGIAAKGTEEIAYALPKLPIKYLDLSFNRIGDSGASAIAKALLTSTTINILKIGAVPSPVFPHSPALPALGTQITKDGLLALAELITKSPSLTWLNLDWNKKAKTDALQVFFSALKRNTILTTFYCANCTAPDNIVVDCFSENKTITEGFGGKSMAMLNKYIRTNKVCKSLNISDEERKTIPPQLQKASEVINFIQNVRTSKA